MLAVGLATLREAFGWNRLGHADMISNRHLACTPSEFSTDPACG
jgi:hypothetical protein